jgi:2-keto-3-deoxy-L-rhamnonate aldolase RhmA
VSNPFLDRFAKGELQIGTLTQERVVTTMRGLARGGFSWIVLDLMWGWNSWQDLSHMVLAAREQNLASFIRVQSFPWRDDEHVDHRVLVDVARAGSLRPDGIIFSPNNGAEVQLVAQVANDWHTAGGVDSTPEEVAATGAARKADLVLSPLIETLGSLRDLEQIINTDGIKSVIMSSTDLPMKLGYPFEYDHPEVFKYLSRAVKLGQDAGVAVGTNTGYIFTTVDATVARIKRLQDVGIDHVMVQHIDHMVYSYTKSLMDGLGEPVVKRAVA